MNVAGTGLKRRDLVVKKAVRGYFPAALFRRPIQLRRHLESVPVNVFRYVSAIEDLNGCRDSFPQSDQRAWCGSVISGGCNRVSGRNFDLRAFYPEYDVSGPAGNAAVGRLLCPQAASCRDARDKSAAGDTPVAGRLLSRDS